jgi:hypothetical protein
MLKSRLILLSLLSLWLVPAAMAAKPAAPAPSPEQQLAGLWQDEKDPENIIRFLPTHAVQVYLPKGEGKLKNMHWIPGRWSLAPDMTLTLHLNMSAGGGSTMTKTFKVSFEKGVMVVKSGGAVVGRQRRITEAALKKYLW